jgi:hypothetical protein
MQLCHLSGPTTSAVHSIWHACTYELLQFTLMPSRLLRPDRFHFSCLDEASKNISPSRLPILFLGDAFLSPSSCDTTSPIYPLPFPSHPHLLNFSNPPALPWYLGPSFSFLSGWICSPLSRHPTNHAQRRCLLALTTDSGNVGSARRKITIVSRGFSPSPVHQLPASLFVFHQATYVPISYIRLCLPY